MYSQSVRCSIHHSVSWSGTQLHSQSCSCSISHSVNQSGTQLHSHSVAQSFILSADQVPSCTVSLSVSCSGSQYLGNVSCSFNQTLSQKYIINHSISQSVSCKQTKEDYITIFLSCIVLKLYYQLPNPSA